MDFVLDLREDYEEYYVRCKEEHGWKTLKVHPARKLLTADNFMDNYSHPMRLILDFLDATSLKRFATAVSTNLTLSKDLQIEYKIVPKTNPWLFDFTLPSCQLPPRRRKDVCTADKCKLHNTLFPHRPSFCWCDWCLNDWENGIYR